MTTIVEIRRNNLSKVIKQIGTQKKLADLLGTHRDYISQMHSNSEKYPMSNDFARNIERVLELDHGWMDKDHDNPLTEEQRGEFFDMLTDGFSESEREDVKVLLELIKKKREILSKHS